MECPGCGRANDPGLRYCVGCGEGLTGEDPANAVQLDLEPGLPPGTVLRDTYETIRLLGEGGAGAVYEGRHVTLGHAVAIKVLFADLARVPQIRERFISEGRIQANLSHPNLVRVFDIVEHPGLVAIVMELVEGPTLYEYIQLRRSPISPSTAVSIVLRLLAGLSAAHAQGIVHRDIKPGNVLLAKAEAGIIPKLADFGIAKVTAKRSLTVTGTKMGTVDYMAPEQFKNPRGVDLRADIYSLGITFYQLLTRRLPFESDNEYALMRAHADVKPPRLRGFRPDIDAALEEIVLKALEKRPENRFQSADELANALVALPAFQTLSGFRSIPMVSSEGDGAAPVQSAESPPTPETRESPRPPEDRRVARRLRVDAARSRLEQRRLANTTPAPRRVSRFGMFLGAFAACLVLVFAIFLGGRSASRDVPVETAEERPDRPPTPGAGAVALEAKETGEGTEQSPTTGVEARPENPPSASEEPPMRRCMDLLDRTRPHLRAPTTLIPHDLGERIESEVEICREVFTESLSDNALDRLFGQIRGDQLLIARHLYRLQAVDDDRERCNAWIPTDHGYARATRRIEQMLHNDQLLPLEADTIRALGDELAEGHVNLSLNYSCE